MSRNDEIIILRRMEEEAAPKKGGVWKIAHADFMTAMMAFFLIMWLVNATDEEIKKSIANYFNPLNLMSQPVDSRGINDPREDAVPATGDQQGEPSDERAQNLPATGNGQGGGNVEEGNERTMASAGILRETDNAAFNDPFATVASAAADIDPENPTAVDVPQSTLGVDGVTQSSEQTRDPFDPAYWQTVQTRAPQTLNPGRANTADINDPQAEIDAAAARPRGEEAEAAVASAAPAQEGPASPAQIAGPDEATTEAQSAFAGPRSTLAEQILAQAATQPQEDRQAPDPSPAQPGAEEVDPAEARRAALAEEAVEELQQALSGASAQVSVSEGEGPATVLIALTDEDAFSMFPIGSSAPTDEASALFARVGTVLSDRAGSIVVRGHTDARPFRGGTSDNWTLSFERAHATKTALAGSGIDEGRFVRVEGLADREPANAEDLFADENRRIEILYQPAAEAP